MFCLYIYCSLLIFSYGAVMLETTGRTFVLTLTSLEGKDGKLP